MYTGALTQYLDSAVATDVYYLIIILEFAHEEECMKESSFPASCGRICLTILCREAVEMTKQAVAFFKVPVFQPL